MRAAALSLYVGVCLLLGCGPHAGPVHATSSWSAPALFTEIPADTPYVLASIDRLDDALRARMNRGVTSELAKLIASADTLVKAQDEPWKRAAAAVIDSLRGTNLEKWYETVGLGTSPQFAWYGLGLYPVVRAELADAAKLRALVTKAIAAAGTGIVASSLRGVSYWSIAVGTSSVVIAVTATELVAAYVPTPQLASLLPLILGVDRPAASLADVMTVPDTLKKYGFNRTLIAQVDIGRLGAAVTQAAGSPLGSPQCQDDVARLASYTPRILAGYRHLDADGYALGVVVEVAPGIADVLAKVRTPVPQMPREGTPMFELVAGIDVDALIDAVRTAVHQLRNQPFRCELLATMSQALDDLGQKLDEPLPPDLRGLRGADLVLDDVAMSPPTVRGAVLVLGENLASAFSRLVGKVSPLGSFTIPDDGSPVALPVALLNLKDVDSAHVAVRGGIAALAIDPHSKERVTKALAAAPDPHAPLMSFTWDILRTLERLPTLADTLANVRNMKHVDMSLELRERALDFEFDAGWP